MDIYIQMWYIPERELEAQEVHHSQSYIWVGAQGGVLEFS